jgi:dTDP-4-dehydrorhamnose 3,5-epimerase
VKFRESGIHGGWIIELDRIGDERGWFARAWCAEEFAAHGLPSVFPQANMSFGYRAGTVRGLHVQLPPHHEGKAVRCVRGRVFDVAVDLRPDSPTYLQSAGVELDADDDSMVYLPAGCAHGYQSIVDDSTVYYMTTTPYTPGAERGLRWDDPLVAVDWPVTEGVTMSEKDRSWPRFDEPSWHLEHDRAGNQGSQA